MGDILMGTDIIAHLRPLREARKRISNDTDALHEVMLLWRNASGILLFEAVDSLRDDDVPKIELPLGYDELTYLLAWWCDRSPYSIDPTPLTDCLRYAQRIESEGRVGRFGDTLDHYGQSLDRVVPVLNRMTYAMVAHEAANRRLSNRRLRRELNVALLHPDYRSGILASL